MQSKSNPRPPAWPSARTPPTFSARWSRTATSACTRRGRDRARLNSRKAPQQRSARVVVRASWFITRLRLNRVVGRTDSSKTELVPPNFFTCFAPISPCARGNLSFFSADTKGRDSWGRTPRRAPTRVTHSAPRDSGAPGEHRLSLSARPGTPVILGPFLRGRRRGEERESFCRAPTDLRCASCATRVVLALTCGCPVTTNRAFPDGERQVQPENRGASEGAYESHAWRTGTGRGGGGGEGDGNGW